MINPPTLSPRKDLDTPKAKRYTAACNLSRPRPRSKVVKFDVSQLSIVIASVGRSSLNRVLLAIDSWTQQPSVVIIALPNNGIGELDFIPLTPTFFFRSSSRGQVLQRIEGFRRVTTTYTLQIDDDIAIDYESLFKLGETLLVNRKSAVGTVIRYENQIPRGVKECLRTNSRIGILKYAINGVTHQFSNAGKDTLSGVPNYLTPENCPFGMKEVDYVSGGAMLHYRDNLIIEDYYPFAGRADYEDLFHCLELRKSGLKILFQATEGVVHEEIKEPFQQSLTNILGREHVVLKKYNEVSGRSNIRLFLHTGLHCLAHIKNVFLRLLFRAIKNLQV